MNGDLDLDQSNALSGGPRDASPIYVGVPPAVGCPVDQSVPSYQCLLRRSAQLMRLAWRLIASMVEPLNNAHNPARHKRMNDSISASDRLTHKIQFVFKKIEK
jgi:hypothetical protein